MTQAHRNYSEIADRWTVEASEQYSSPQPTETVNDTQMLVFPQLFQDGKIDASLKVISGKRVSNGGEAKVAGLCFRFRNAKECYFAGIGAYGSKFSIGKCVNGTSQQIASSGDSSMLKEGDSYYLTIRCRGSQIALLENGVEQLSTTDEALQDGHWGLRTWKTQATFRDLSCSANPPKCFVVTPFDASFDPIADTIEKAVEECKYEYDRADLRFVTEPFLEDIKERIERANSVLVDLTGQNPNVYFEAGYAHVLKKKVIFISQNVGTLPSDVRHLRTFPYVDRIGGDVKLFDDLKKAIKQTSLQ